MKEIKLLDFEAPVAELEEKIQELGKYGSDDSVDFSAEISKLRTKQQDLLKKIFANLSPLQKFQLARHPQRPFFLDYVKYLCEEFTELHGDRQFADDKAMVCGIARIGGEPVMLIGHQKGRTTEENLMRNFGMAQPEGYRKALRMMQMAEKFKMPIVTFIDTMGAYPGLEAEERGQGEAIARNLREMSALTVPIICVVIGEGGSGGALGIGVGDRILMLENSIYSVISPEGCASILWRDSTKAAEAAVALKITAPELIALGVIDEIVKEPLGGAHRDFETAAANLKEAILRNLEELKKLPPAKLPDKRHEKFRKMGAVGE
jgi:acetyl-CoA carboxylase carboxyl transferase subunit alpha